MEVNFTKLGSVLVIKLSFLSPNPDFGTVLWDIGTDCPQTSLLFRQLAPCYDWTIGGVLLAAGRRQGSGRYKGLALSRLLLVPVTVAPGSGSCFQVFRFLGFFFFRLQISRTSLIAPSRKSQHQGASAPSSEAWGAVLHTPPLISEVLVTTDSSFSSFPPH